MITSEHVKSLAIYCSKRALVHLFEAISFIIGIFFPSQRSKLPQIDDGNLIMTATKLSQFIRSGHLTSEEVVESYIARIKRVNPIINAVVDNRFNEAIKEAREIDRKIQDALDAGEKSNPNSILNKPLVGVPVSIKETIAVDGKPYTGGLLGRKYIRAPKNAASVERLIQAGLVPICLTNIPEMAMWWDSSNPLYGRSCNPYDLSRITGGSSGGEAAILAAAGSVVGLGSDIAGSIRIPANFCGVFGHKPTPFVVPTEGMYPSCSTDQLKLLGVGPMCRYAADLAPMLNILAGDKASRLRLDVPVDLTKVKIYFCEDICDPLASHTSSDIVEGIRKAVQHMADKYKTPANVIKFEEFGYGLFLWSAEASSTDEPTMAQKFKDGRGELNPIVELAKKVVGKSDHTMNSILASTLEKLSPAPGTKEHRIITRKAEELRTKFNDLLGDDGVFIMPAHPEGAVKHHTTLFKVGNTSYTAVGNCLQAPITQCPLGMTREGMPFGVQIIAKPFNDRLTIAVAEEFEKAFGGWAAPCRVSV